MTTQLLNAVNATGAGASIKPLRRSIDARANQGVFQVSGITTATVSIQGRADPSAPWVDLQVFTSDGSIAVQLMNEMRANVSAYTSGTISAWLNI